jgi:hypothetical protein
MSWFVSLVFQRAIPKVQLSMLAIQKGRQKFRRRESCTGGAEILSSGNFFHDSSTCFSAAAAIWMKHFAELVIVKKV